MIHRFEDLLERSRKNNTYYFSDFLSQADAALVWSVAGEGEVRLFGGAEGTERNVARFGSPEDFGYEVDFPIVALCVEPLNAKFADKLTHRDFLGALMNLGIDRAVIGDIFVNDATAYIFALEKIAPFIEESLTRVKHTSVKTHAISIAEIPEGIKPKLTPMEVIVPSLRLDVIIAKCYNLARGKAKGMFDEGQVFLNSRQCENPSAAIKADDTLSVRGYGKLIFREITHETKKGNIVIKVEKYV